MLAIISCHYNIGPTAERETLAIGALLNAHSALGNPGVFLGGPVTSITSCCSSTWHPEAVPGNSHRDATAVGACAKSLLLTGSDDCFSYFLSFIFFFQKPVLKWICKTGFGWKSWWNAAFLKGSSGCLWARSGLLLLHLIWVFILELVWASFLIGLWKCLFLKISRRGEFP